MPYNITKTKHKQHYTETWRTPTPTTPTMLSGKRKLLKIEILKVSLVNFHFSLQHFHLTLDIFFDNYNNPNGLL
jgi:hypothetical protein